MAKKKGKTKKLSDKQRANRKHCERRFKQRFGIKFDGELSKQIVENIKKGKGNTFVKRFSRTRTLHRGVIPGNPEGLVIYSSSTKDIVTAYNES